MEIGRQIKKYRQEQKFSQDELAEKIFVTRQTISNWENDKNYPDIKKFKNAGTIYTILLIASIILAVPLTYIFGKVGWVVWMAIYAVTMVYSIQVSKLQKKHNIKTYREIVAFTEGRTLDELERSCERGKRPYQEIIFIVGTGVIAIIVAKIAYYLLS